VQSRIGFDLSQTIGPPVRIQSKIFLALLATSSMLVGIMFVLMQWSIDRGMLEYVNVLEAEKLQNVVSRLTQSYSREQNWQQLKQRRNWHQLIREFNGQAQPAPQGADKEGIRPFSDSDQQPNKRRSPPPRIKNLAVLDKNEQVIVGDWNPKIQHKRPINRLPIIYKNETVGWLVLPKKRKITDGFELQFLQQQQMAFGIISLIVIALSMIIALPLARHFVGPINRLAAGMLALTQGDFNQSINIDRKDELGQLARDFSSLATTLSNNEESRNRWLADISHELRTPLAILKGELEAMTDGVRPINIEQLQSLHQETEQLRRLVDDLYQLSNADIGGMRYQKKSLNLNAIVQQQSDLHRHILQQEQLELVTEICTNNINVWADQTRINQLLDNLFSNSNKYTSSPGQVKISLQQQQQLAILSIEDSTPGVPATSLEKLFNHLYRVDSSRNRATGGSGLGLAICKQIVNAHDGTVEAQASALGGLRIVISLPIDQIS
jgi:two-component system sensor histidine kinase BaeS